MNCRKQAIAPPVFADVKYGCGTKYWAGAHWLPPATFKIKF